MALLFASCDFFATSANAFPQLPEISVLGAVCSVDATGAVALAAEEAVSAEAAVAAASDAFAFSESFSALFSASTLVVLSIS